MKNKSFYSIKSILTLIPLTILIILIGCQDEEARHFYTDLGINNSIVRVADSTGTTRILVHADGAWNAYFKDPEVSWVSIQSGSGTGLGEFLLSFKSNKNQLPRSTKIVVEGGMKTDTVTLQQLGLTPTIEISDTAITGIAGGGRMKSGISCNIPFNLITQKITYRTTNSSNWLSEVSIENHSLKFKLAKSTENTIREVKLKLSYTDALGSSISDSLIIKQNPQFENESEDAKAVDFNYIKKSLSEGTITENIYFEGIVVSDKGNPNIATNQNSKSNIQTIDPRENQITVYIQDPENKNGGILVKTKSGSDNIFDRYDRVKLWLKNTKLTKLTEPLRYVIEDIETVHILEKNEGDPISAKEMYIKDITDNDLYTFVKLKEVEIAIPTGSFSNINEGYNKRTSVYPTCIRDINGNNMYMLTNIDVPYRRDGNQVPQGSGNISGIIVHDVLPRYGNNIGRYSIRQLSREEIDLAEDRDNGFSKVIVEWSRYKIGEEDPLAPDTGAELGAKLSHSKSKIGAGPDFNGLTISTATVNNGGFSATNWWNNNKGESWIIEFSTIGITKTLSLQLEGDVIYGGPRNHIVEWSDKNDENAIWNQVAEYTWQDLVIAGKTLLTQVPGHKVIDFKLPETILNRQKIYIRLRVKDNKAGTATSELGATINNTKACRLGHISIKHNKYTRGALL